MSNYYIARPGMKSAIGPLTPAQLCDGVEQGTITEDCLYYTEGMDKWESVITIPGLFTPQPRQQPPVKRPPYAAPQPRQQVPLPPVPPPAAVVRRNPSRPKVEPYTSVKLFEEDIPPHPGSGMAMSILVTIFCCFPFGIIAIVQSARCNALYNNGSYIEAIRASRSAVMWQWIAAITMIVFYIFTFIAPVLDK